MSRARTLVLAALALLLLGAGPYRLGDPPPPPVIRTLNTYLLYDLHDPARPSLRFAIALSVSGWQDGDELEAAFEDPADARRTLPGAPASRAGVPEDQFGFTSPELAGVQCRAYNVTVRLVRRGDALATHHDKIRSRLDAAALAAGGADAARRAEQGEPVCGA